MMVLTSAEPLSYHGFGKMKTFLVLLMITICSFLSFSLHGSLTVANIRAIQDHFVLGNKLEQIRKYVDIHYEHPAYGHVWSDEEEISQEVDPRNIAIGMGITTKGHHLGESLEKFSFFETFLPSFCQTCSGGFHYQFFMAYDVTDNLFKTANFADGWAGMFSRVTKNQCPKASNYSIHLIQCSHSGKPAWAQNDAMIEAYFSNMAYYYRPNDDTVFEKGNWTEGFIKKLSEYNPSNIGVVGPNHKGGNVAILTYDFVHISHIEIFGLYYPRVFESWWGDDWMTYVYQPGRMTKMEEFPVNHTRSEGQRYHVTGLSGDQIHGTVKAGRQHLLKYINVTGAVNGSVADGRKVISMGLWGVKPEYTWGAVRNAQLAPVHLPGWKLRVYISNKNNNLSVPLKVLSKLKQLGAEVININTQTTDDLPPESWRLLVGLDKSVTHFLIRDADTRLSEREAVLVNDWLDSDKAFHCIRDHTEHKNTSIVDGLWGGRRAELDEILSWNDIIFSFNQSLSLYDHLNTTSYTIDNLLNLYWWPKVVTNSYCHDSVSCSAWPMSVKFPERRNDPYYLGERMKPFAVPLPSAAASLRHMYDDACFQD